VSQAVWALAQVRKTRGAGSWLPATLAEVVVQKVCKRCVEVHDQHAQLSSSDDGCGARLVLPLLRCL
jgi:hypothetical protein